jgi:hypothetical protein
MNANASNITNSTQPPIDYVNIVLSNISLAADVITLVLHLIYFLLIFLSDELKKRTYLYANHAIVASIFYPILMTIYLFITYPNTADPNINRILCTVSEIGWVFSKYIRMFSILLIALYRYIAVFKITWYKKINDSYVLLISPLVLIWIISIGCPIASKFIFQTGVSPSMCLDGNSQSFGMTLGYFFFNYTIMTFAPAVLIVVIYVWITRKLNSMSSKFHTPAGTNTLQNGSRENHSLETTHPNHSVGTAGAIYIGDSSHKIEKKKERKFANQFLILCSFMMFTVIGLSIFQLRNIIPGYFTVMINWRIAIRIWVAINIAASPITSIYFHPSRSKFMKGFKSRIMPSSTL